MEMVEWRMWLGSKPIGAPITIRVPDDAQDHEVRGACETLGLEVSWFHVYKGNERCVRVYPRVYPKMYPKD